jgi:hypothetical protein
VQSAWRRCRPRVVVRARSGKEASASCCRGAWQAMILRSRLLPPWPSRAIVRRCHQRCAAVGMAPSGIATLANPDLSQRPTPSPSKAPLRSAAANLVVPVDRILAACSWRCALFSRYGQSLRFAVAAYSTYCPSANLPPSDKNTNKFGCVRFARGARGPLIGRLHRVVMPAAGLPRTVGSCLEDIRTDDDTSESRQRHRWQLALTTGAVGERPGCAATMRKSRSTCGWTFYRSGGHVLYMYRTYST